MSVDGLRCILYARIYIQYMHTILYYYVYVTALPLRHYSAYQNSIYRHVNYLQQVIILTKLHVFLLHNGEIYQIQTRKDW